MTPEAKKKKYCRHCWSVDVWTRFGVHSGDAEMSCSKCFSHKKEVFYVWSDEYRKELENRTCSDCGCPHLCLDSSRGYVPASSCVSELKREITELKEVVSSLKSSLRSL